MLGFTKQELRIVAFLVFSLLLGVAVRVYKHHFYRAELAQVDPVFAERFRARSDSIRAGLMTVEPAGESDVGPVKVFSDSFTVNVNTATALELQQIPKIGPVLAEKIVTYREEQGRFATVEELMEVKGIGRKTLERIGPYIVLK